MAAGMDFTAIAAGTTFATVVAVCAMLVEIRRLGRIDVWSTVRLPVASAVVVGALLVWTAPLLVRSLWSLGLVAAVAGAAGLAVNLWSDRAALLGMVRRTLARELSRASRRPEGR
jgi:Zn-dependent protease